MFAERVEGEGCGDAIGEEEGCGEPIYGGLLGIEVLRGGLRDRGERDPVPGHHDVEENKLGETKETALVHFVCDWAVGGDLGERSLAEEGWCGFDW